MLELDWVLIIIMDWGQAMAIDHIPFATEDLCNSAKWIIDQAAKAGWHTFCLPVKPQ